MKQKHHHKKLNTASVILSFILSILLTIAGYLLGSCFGIFRSNLIPECAGKTAYYDSVYDTLVKDCILLGRPMMLPKETFQDIFDSADLYNDIKQAFYANLDNRSYTPDTSSIRQKLQSNIYQYARQNQIELGPDQEKIIQSFITSIEKEYTDNLNIPFITYYSSFKGMYNKFFLMILAIVLTLAAVDFFFLMRSHKYKHRSLRYVTYSTLAAALMTGVPPLFLYLQGSYKALNLKPEYFHNLIVEIVNSSLFSFVYVALFFLVVSVGLMYATKYIKNIVKNKKY